ncbi:MAG: ADP-ribosylglycohydrolase family protein [Barnesiella sp.]|nr:ADP-ribosylglycohydrolase family protein [Barnesiella sp.]
MKTIGKKRIDTVRDLIRGSLIGGAVGDALGYPVEFMSMGEIINNFGIKGITGFVTDSKGHALISDDTQMTLFTANGMLMGLTRGYMRGIGGIPENYVEHAYMDWYLTQVSRETKSYGYSWLSDVPEMFAQRAPGITCLNACENLINHEKVINNSKGCGGIMRVAPMALLLAGYEARGESPYHKERMIEAGAKIASITHKHPLGFLPAGALTYLIYKLITAPSGDKKSDIVKYATEAANTVLKMYEREYHRDAKYLSELTHKAINLSINDRTDIENISELGRGNVAEETWAIALYCAIRHADNPEAAIIASVNHDGDSDSTGAVCGNIMGAIYGYRYLSSLHIFCPSGKTLEQTLELSDIILTMADDLTSGCVISEYDPINTPEKKRWYERYCLMKAAGVYRSDK